MIGLIVYAVGWGVYSVKFLTDADELVTYVSFAFWGIGLLLWLAPILLQRYRIRRI